ncbi:MAG: GNAT family N-acetyltransferase [Acidobacteria bacterium]|nr:GNAT family N-acetyltransferase [Acidobacteriota bacterium]
MVSMHRCSDLSELDDLKTAYLQSLVAPMDGMWEAGFVPQAKHWKLKVRDQPAGFCAITDEGALLQFFLLPAFEADGAAVLQHIAAQDSVNKAVVSTIDPFFLSLCLDAHKQVSTHTYMYELGPDTETGNTLRTGAEFSQVSAAQLDRTVNFQRSCLGGDESLTEWLRGYSGNLIERAELFVLHRGDEWIGLGECRKSDSQEGVADVGMMVSHEHRREGWATEILRRLKSRAMEADLRPICSTTVDNPAAQKAIIRAGFASHHRIMDVSL